MHTTAYISVRDLWGHSMKRIRFCVCVCVCWAIVGSVSLAFACYSWGPWIRKIIVNIKIYRLSTVDINFNANLSGNTISIYYPNGIVLDLVYIFLSLHFFLFAVISTKKVIIRNVDYVLCLCDRYIVIVYACNQSCIKVGTFFFHTFFEFTQHAKHSNSHRTSNENCVVVVVFFWPYFSVSLIWKELSLTLYG